MARVKNEGRWGQEEARSRYVGGTHMQVHDPLRGKDEHSPQAPEDKHYPGYDNDVPLSGWLRTDGTQKPSFDKGNAWRKKGRSI